MNEIEDKVYAKVNIKLNFGKSKYQVDTNKTELD